VFISLKKTL